jgi:hypothetical protein
MQNANQKLLLFVADTHKGRQANNKFISIIIAKTEVSLEELNFRHLMMAI